MKHLLTIVCVFAIAAGAWLGIMEKLLKHPGYIQRSIVAGGIVVQAVVTLAWATRTGWPALRALVVPGAIGIIYIGASALIKDLRAAHFEGFVLVAGIALVLQGGLTLALLPFRAARF